MLKENAQGFEWKEYQGFPSEIVDGEDRAFEREIQGIVLKARERLDSEAVRPSKDTSRVFSRDIPQELIVSFELRKELEQILVGKRVNKFEMTSSEIARVEIDNEQCFLYGSEDELLKRVSLQELAAIRLENNVVNFDAA